MLGTPAAFTPNIIQLPPTAIPGSAGILTVTGLSGQRDVKGPQSSMRRWSVLVLCVAELMRIMEIIISCSLDATSIKEPCLAVELLMLIVGRGASEPSAANKYGGLKISVSRWLGSTSPLHRLLMSFAPLPHKPPPPVNTLPSGSNAATLWYVLPNWCLASSNVNFSVAGSQISAGQQSLLHRQRSNQNVRVYPPSPDNYRETKRPSCTGTLSRQLPLLMRVEKHRQSDSCNVPQGGRGSRT